MRKLLSSLATLALLASSTATTVVACSSHKHQNTPPPPGPSTAQQESNKVNNQTITLNDTASATYENKTAFKDTSAIDNAIEATGYLNATQVKDFSFDNTTALKASTNVVKYNVKAPDGSTASGTLNVTINPYKPTPPPPPPGPSTAQQESNKVNNQTITLNDTASATYENKTAFKDTSAIDNAIEAAKYLNTTQVKDFSFDNTKKLSTGTNSGVGFNVTAQDGSKATGTFNIIIKHPFSPLPPSNPKESIINPSTPTTAKKESDQVNNKSITLNDSASVTYENNTAQADMTAIDNAITTAGYLNTTQVKDLSFDNTTALKASTNAVKYNVKAPDGSTASGTLNVIINPYKPTPPPPPPGPSTAQQEANKVNNQTITLNDTASTTYEKQTAQTDMTAIDNAITTAGYLNTTQVKDLSFDNTKNLSTGTNSGIGFNVNAPDQSKAKGTFNIVINHPLSPLTPSTTSTAQQEANKVNNQTITLNDTASTTYEKQTAQTDMTAIDNAITTAGYLNTTQVKDLSFDNTKNLSTGTNSGISFNVNAPDQSKAKGTFNIVINPYKPTPPTPGTGGLGMSKSVPYLDINDAASGANGLTPQKVYNTFGVHQVMVSFANAFDKTGAAWSPGTKFTDMTSKQAQWIKQYEALGGSIGISFGGPTAGGAYTTPWDNLTTTQMESMLNTAVTQYHAKAIDYDLEAKVPFDKTEMQNLVDATNAELTKDPNLDISLTLPVVPDDKTTGSKFWGSQADFSTDAVQIFAKFQKTPIINIRAYNFGPYYNPTGGDYAKVIESVVTSTDTYWSNIFKIDPTHFMQKDEEVTTMIGRSDQASKQAILTSQLAQEFATWAKQQKLFRLSFNDINRDFPGPFGTSASYENSGTDNPAGTYAQINEKYFE